MSGLASGGDSGDGDLSLARDQIRGAARWFIAGLGGIGAVLIAGSQVSSIGSLPPGPRLVAGILGVSIGLLAILWAIWRVVDVLAGKRWAFEDVAQDWQAAEKLKKTDGSLPKRARRQNPVAVFFIEHPSTLGEYKDPSEILELYKASDADRKGLPDLVKLMHDIVDKAATIDLSERFRRARPQIAGGVLIGAIGIVLFAWAANPPKENGTPSMHNAILRGVDFKGSSLRGVDLSGADLTNANLKDSDLRKAKLDGAIWINTICPDGSNSDSRAVVKNAKPVGGTCAGHLSP